MPLILELYCTYRMQTKVNTEKVMFVVKTFRVIEKI